MDYRICDRLKQNFKEKCKTAVIKTAVQTVDKGHECHMMFVAFSMQSFKEIVEI